MKKKDTDGEERLKKEESEEEREKGLERGRKWTTGSWRWDRVRITQWTA